MSQEQLTRNLSSGLIGRRSGTAVVAPLKQRPKIEDTFKEGEKLNPGMKYRRFSSLLLDNRAPDAGSFTVARSARYWLDAPNRSRPKLPLPESDGLPGIAPGVRDAEAGDLRLHADSPVRSAVARRDGQR